MKTRVLVIVPTAHCNGFCWYTGSDESKVQGWSRSISYVMPAIAPLKISIVFVHLMVTWSPRLVFVSPVFGSKTFT